MDYVPLPRDTTSSLLPPPSALLPRTLYLPPRTLYLLQRRYLLVCRRYEYPCLRGRRLCQLPCRSPVGSQNLRFLSPCFPPLQGMRATSESTPSGEAQGPSQGGFWRGRCMAGRSLGASASLLLSWPSAVERPCTLSTLRRLGRCSLSRPCSAVHADDGARIARGGSGGGCGRFNVDVRWADGRTLSRFGVASRATAGVWRATLPANERRPRPFSATTDGRLAWSARDAHKGNAVRTMSGSRRGQGPRCLLLHSAVPRAPCHSLSLRLDRFLRRSLFRGALVGRCLGPVAWVGGAQVRRPKRAMES